MKSYIQYHAEIKVVLIVLPLVEQTHISAFCETNQIERHQNIIEASNKTEKKRTMKMKIQAT